MQIFAVGLSQTLTDALRELTVHTPALIPLIQQKLLDLLSQVLANKPFSIPKRGSQLSNTTPTQPVAFVIHPFPPPNFFLNFLKIFICYLKVTWPTRKRPPHNRPNTQNTWFFRFLSTLPPRICQRMCGQLPR